MSYFKRIQMAYNSPPANKTGSLTFLIKLTRQLFAGIMINIGFNVRIQETRAIRSGRNVSFLRDVITIRRIKAEIIAIASTDGPLPSSVVNLLQY